MKYLCSVVDEWFHKQHGIIKYPLDGLCSLATTP